MSPSAVDTAAGGAGRSCPLHYRYEPSVFARSADARTEVLYVVGGLYGNEPALDAVLALFERETGPKRLAFNGDFHWFDTDPDADPDAGCGCAYPASVGDTVVERSNRILQHLRTAANACADLLPRLAALPMQRRVDVGALRVAIVHGDAQSLAGWGFAREHLRDAAQVDAFACSHTCLPVLHTLARAGRPPRVVINNGAAGMPNFRGDAAGLLTRIALRPFDGPVRRHGSVRDGVHFDAIAIDHDVPGWHAQFLSMWPPGSDALASYWDRIAAGPAYAPTDALLHTED